MTSNNLKGPLMTSSNLKWPLKWSVKWEIVHVRLLGSLKYVVWSSVYPLCCSSVQNILLRYGLDNGLNFVLPSTGNHLNDPAHRYIITEPFKLEWLDEESNLLPWHKKLKESRQYDIFNLHTKWNYSAVKWVLHTRKIHQNNWDTFCKPREI